MVIAQAVIDFAKVDGAYNREHAIKAAERLNSMHTVMQGVDIYLFADDSILYIGNDAMVFNKEEYPFTS